jgi:hypothetical protein
VLELDRPAWAVLAVAFAAALLLGLCLGRALR